MLPPEEPLDRFTYGMGDYARPCNWPQETRHIALSYVIDIFTDNYFVLSQCTRLTDRQTDVDNKSAPYNIVRCALEMKVTSLHSTQARRAAQLLLLIIINLLLLLLTSSSSIAERPRCRVS